jgi:hypothetical protein
MKGKTLAIVSVLCVVCLVVFVAEAKPKNPKPPPTTTEWIAFSQNPNAPSTDGYLEGAEQVEGCCPNAGPFPPYAMTLQNMGHIPNGTYDGQLFINFYGVGHNQRYIVQFWNDDVDIEIIGGDIDNDRRNKILTVTFTGTNSTCWDYKNGLPIPNVSFVLVRAENPPE